MIKQGFVSIKIFFKKYRDKILVGVITSVIAGIILLLIPKGFNKLIPFLLSIWECLFKKVTIPILGIIMFLLICIGPLLKRMKSYFLERVTKYNLSDEEKKVLINMKRINRARTRSIFTYDFGLSQERLNYNLDKLKKKGFLIQYRYDRYGLNEKGCAYLIENKLID